MEQYILMKRKQKSTKESCYQEKQKEEESKKKEINNCWNCIYYKSDTYDFIGKCNWWFLYKKLDPKEIPNNIVDKGCKFWRSDNDSFHPLIEDIILKFQGVLID